MDCKDCKLEKQLFSMLTIKFYAWRASKILFEKAKDNIITGTVVKRKNFAVVVDYDERDHNYMFSCHKLRRQANGQKSWYYEKYRIRNDGTLSTKVLGSLCIEFIRHGIYPESFRR